jgi:hypothetical protein
MRTLHRVAVHCASLWFVLLPVLSGCTDTVFRDRETFNPPPDAANKFLGYFTSSDKQTTCGNCHVTHQAAWVQTAHASAYHVPDTSSNVGPQCYTCHSVSARGNAVADPAGWDVVHDTAYYDVQCENCHGPGLDHVQAPDAPKSESNPPLAHIAVPITADFGPVDSATITNSASCGSCHNQNSGPGVRAYEEWAQSGHAHVVLEAGGASPADNPQCVSCHEAKGILAAWGVTAEYAERGQTGSANYLGQTCAVCHDPHGSAKDPTTGEPLAHQLRFPISTPDVNQQLCMKCHQRRSVPDQASARGPHSPQGPMLLGDAGYQPAGFQPDLQAVASTHGTDRNPELCAGCHVQRLTGTDVATGKPAVSAGHLFLAIPCLDAGGLPVTTDCPDDEPSRSWAACTASGCHASATTAVAAFTVITQDVDRLTKQIWDDKNANDAIDPDSTACSAGALRIRVQGTPPVTDTIPCANPTGSTTTDDENRANWDAGLLARTDIIPTIGASNQYVTNDNTITPAEGARFNVRMLRIEGGADGSHGVHNPFLARALLGADITELQATYPGLPAASAAVQEMMNGSLGAMLKRVYHPPANARLSLSR